MANWLGRLVWVDMIVSRIVVPGFWTRWFAVVDDVAVAQHDGSLHERSKLTHLVEHCHDGDALRVKPAEN